MAFKVCKSSSLLMYNILTWNSYPMSCEWSWKGVVSIDDLSESNILPDVTYPFRVKEVFHLEDELRKRYSVLGENPIRCAFDRGGDSSLNDDDKKSTSLSAAELAWREYDQVEKAGVPSAFMKSNRSYFIASSYGESVELVQYLPGNIVGRTVRVKDTGGLEVDQHYWGYVTDYFRATRQGHWEPRQENLVRIVPRVVYSAFLAGAKPYFMYHKERGHKMELFAGYFDTEGRMHEWYVGHLQYSADLEIDVRYCGLIRDNFTYNNECWSPRWARMLDHTEVCPVENSGRGLSYFFIMRHGDRMDLVQRRPKGKRQVILGQVMDTGGLKPDRNYWGLVTDYFTEYDYKCWAPKQPDLTGIVIKRSRIDGQ